MKKRLTVMALAACMVAAAGAQTVYDATSIAQKELNGTARFVGMGGAMSALGGDISTIGTNPAGIGIYRSNDAMLTLGYSLTGTESNMAGDLFENNKARWSFDNAGFVLSTKFSNQAPLRYVNFGFNYHKRKTFYKNMSLEGLINLGTRDAILSQTNQMAGQANGMLDYGTDIAQIGDGYNLYDQPDVGYLAALGWDGYLYNEAYDGDNFNGYTGYLPQPYAQFRSREKGGVDQFDFNIAFNFNERFYLGFTVGAYDVNYEKNTAYDEDYDNGEGYLLRSFNRIDGSGFDVKFGAIFRPVETSPLRIGLAVHTPTFYNLTYKTGAILESDIYTSDDAAQTTPIDVNTYQQIGGDMRREYQLRTPWLLNVSMGYTVGNYLALDAEYEYEDYSSMKFRDVEGFEESFEFENTEVDYCLKGVSTLRIGAELKPADNFSLRAGYNYSTAAFKNDSYKNLPANSINTDTDYANNKEMNTFTLGLGYRHSNFYADLAYKYDTYKSDFYLFDDADLQAVKVTNTRSKVLLTVGMRF